MVTHSPDQFSVSSGLLNVSEGYRAGIEFLNDAWRVFPAIWWVPRHTCAIESIPVVYYYFWFKFVNQPQQGFECRCSAAIKVRITEDNDRAVLQPQTECYPEP